MYTQWDFILLKRKVKFTGKWIDLKSIVLSEVTHIQNHMLHADPSFERSHVYMVENGEYRV